MTIPAAVLSAFLYAWLIAVLLVWAVGLLVVVGWVLLTAWAFVLTGWDWWRGKQGRAVG